MTIIQSSQEEITAAQIQKLIDSAGRAVESSAHFINEAHSLLWSLPDAELVAFLNHLGPAKVGEIFETHAGRGEELNSVLESFGSARRVTIGSRKNVEWNGETFVINESVL